MDVPEIDVAELAVRLGDGGALIDVRELDEWVEVRIPGVQLIPMSEFTQRTDELPSGSPIHVVCRSGARSHQVAEYLIANGIDAVNIAGGTLAWVDAGHATESGPG